MYGFLLALNAGSWLGTVLVAHSYPGLLGLGALAYGFGLRHAVDPDHIAAIDNTTRKLMQEGKQPVAVGFFFSLGHSTVVVLLSVLVALSAAVVHRDLPAIQSASSVIGTSVSCLFLLLIGGINLVALWQVVHAWRRVVHGEPYDETVMGGLACNGGVLTRLFCSVLRIVGESWHMYPIGFLFGLGFDTASEVALLGLSATTGASGLPIWSILLLPLLFTAGMSLVDTTDGVLMQRAYGWAYMRPASKLYYNMTITVISVVIALCIGGIEGVQVIRQETGAHGGAWESVGHLQLSALGVFIVGVFVASWLVSILIYKVRGYDRLDVVSAE